MPLYKKRRRTVRLPARNFRLPANCYALPMAEKKVLDNDSMQLQCINTGAVAALNLIQAGTAQYQRLGNRIYMKSLQLRGNFYVKNAPAAAISNQLARLVIIYDRQVNGTFPILSDIFRNYLQTGPSALAADGSMFSHPGSWARFTILLDKQIQLPGVPAGSLVWSNQTDPTQRLQIVKFRKLFNLCTDYISASNPAVIGDITSGALYALTFADDATYHWVCELSTRLRFGDT